MTIASLMLTYPAIAFCLQGTSLTPRDFALPIWKPTTASLLTACVLILLQRVVDYPAAVLLQITLSGMLFSILYVTIFSLLPGGFVEIKRLLVELRRILALRLSNFSGNS
jgi:hypothetical protein